MALNFPDSPTVNDIFTSGGISWEWNGTVWVRLGSGGASVEISDTAPGTPDEGDLWFKSDTLELYIYYDDGDSQQWVTVSGGASDSNLWTNDGVQLYYDGAFNVGIGTATPSSKLDVTGTFNVSSDATVGGNLDTTGTLDVTGITTLSGDLILEGAVEEAVHVLTGTTPTLDPANGTIQTHTLSGVTTYTDGLANGESILLMIDDGSANTVTWPTITWINNGGSAPTLATTGYTVITIWKVAGTLYGALVGDGS